MQTDLPERIDPWKLAAAGGGLRGSIPLQRMPRLISLLSGSEGSVSLVLQTGVDEQNVHYFIGHLEGVVEMICQRCLNPFRFSLAVDYRLGLVQSETMAAELPDGYDTLLVPADGFVMSQWVEDELILALPLVAKHEDVQQCAALGYALPAGGGLAPEGRPHPFAGLSKLLNK